MMYLNQFHKEAVERKMKKIAESKKIADELSRSCCLYEEELRKSQNNVRPSEVERRITE